MTTTMTVNARHRSRRRPVEKKTHDTTTAAAYCNWPRGHCKPTAAWQEGSEGAVARRPAHFGGLQGGSVVLYSISTFENETSETLFHSRNSPSALMSNSFKNENVTDIVFSNATLSRRLFKNNGSHPDPNLKVTPLIITRPHTDACLVGDIS